AGAGRACRWVDGRPACSAAAAGPRVGRCAGRIARTAVTSPNTTKQTENTAHKPRRATALSVRRSARLRADQGAIAVESIFSSDRPELPARLLELLRRGLLPVVPAKGSGGASGDLAQLAAGALPLVGEGRLRPAGDSDRYGRPAGEVLAEHGLAPLRLEPKE